MIYQRKKLKYFDFYIIYIASYINFAPILNRHYREKLKLFLSQCLENINYPEDNKENNKDNSNDNKDNSNDLEKEKIIEFIELIYNFLDINDKEKDLFMNSSSFSDFLKENFIFMHLFSEKVPLIIDFTQFGKDILNDYFQFEKPKDYLIISFNNYTSNNIIPKTTTNNEIGIGIRQEQSPKNEFKEKLEKSSKLGWNLFIDNINDINKIYYMFYDYIHMRYTGERSKRNILIDDHVYAINETFKLFLFKNTFGSTNIINKNKDNKSSLLVNDNIWFNLLFINFNISKDDIKERIFNSISFTRNQDVYNSLKKSKINMVKRIITKEETEKKLIKSILEIDLSGNEEKLNDVKFFNDRFISEYQLHCDCEEMISSLENKYEKQKIGLIDNYDKICTDCSRIYKWVYKLCLFEISYKIDSKSFIHYILEYFDEKFSINNDINIMKESGKNLNFFSKKVANKNILPDKKGIIEEDEDYEVNVTNSDNEENSDYEREEKSKKFGIESKTENIIPVKKEKYIYKTEKDAKSLIIFIYNKIKNIFLKDDLKSSLLLVFGFIYINLQRKVALPFKTIFYNCYLFNESYDEYFEEGDMKKSPIENISDRKWTILDKLNIISGDLLGNILKSINDNNDIWNQYLRDQYKDFNNYFFNNLKFPDKKLEEETSSLIKFIFFYTIKPDKRDYILDIFFDKVLLNETKNKYNYYFENNERYNSLYVKNNYEDYDIVKAFKNFKPKIDHALVLIAPHDNMDIYDKILYEYCYLKMFTSTLNLNNIDNPNKTHFGDRTLSNNFNSSQNNTHINNENSNLENSNFDKKNFSRKSTIKADQTGFIAANSGLGVNMPVMADVKYKEIILDSHNYSDLNQIDFEFIRTSIKSGNVIIIKNSHFLLNQFNEILKEINDIKTEDVSMSFKLILICDINEVIKNRAIYEHCRIINDNLLYEDKNLDSKNKTVKERILSLIYKIPNEVYNLILNNQNYFMRLFLRKVIYYYIAIFGLLQSIQLNNPFKISFNDFVYLCQYIITFIEQENFTEEKYNEFMNIENPSGNNYITFINILDSIFIYSRQIEKEDECKINKFVNELFNFKLFMDPDFYLEMKNIKISVISNDSNSSLNYDLACEDIYKSFNMYSIEDYEYLLPTISPKEIVLKKYDNSNKVFKNLISAINMNYYDEEKIINIENLDLKKIYKYLVNLEETIPASIIYQASEYSLGLESVDEVNVSMFKKNKYGLYYNSLDNTIYNEVRVFNEKLYFLHIQINLISSMITGERIYNNLFYKNFQNLNDDLIPTDFNILNMNENIEKDYDNDCNGDLWTIELFKKIIIYRIYLYKTWLKDGALKCYHLPMFYNIQIFINDLKIHFSRKYYGENDYSKVTPDMISLKFFSTTSPTFNDLCSSKDRNLDFYNKLYNNEIIWVNGLILQNAKLDKDYSQYLIPNKNKEKTNTKMNLVGITYTINKYEEEEEDANNNEKENNEEENEETESNVTESKYSETNGENDEKKEENLEEKKEKIIKKIIIKENKKIKVYIYEKKNRCKYHKYYKENSIGFIEFYVNNDKIDQNYIFEHDIRIIIDEFGDYGDEEDKVQKEDK